MTLKAILNSEQLGELEETQQSYYTEGEDGNYYLDVEGVDDLPTVKGLKSGHQRSKQEKRELKKQLDAIKRKAGPLADLEDVDLSDVDAERIESLLPYLTGEQDIPSNDDKGGDPKNKVDLEKVKANAVKPYEKKLGEIEQERDTYKGKLEKTVRDNALTAALSKAKVDSPYFDAAMAMFRPKVKIIEDEGEFVPVIDDDEFGGELPVDKYVKEWAQTDQGKAFIQASGNSGGGARGGNGKASPSNPWDPKNEDLEEQSRIYRENPDRAKQLAAQFGKRVGTR